MGVGELTRARDRLLAADALEASAAEVCAEVVQAIREVAPFEWCAVLTTDPETMLPSGGIVEGFSADDCAPFWDNELVDPDFLKFCDLARSVDPVATLVEAVDGDLERSPRYMKLYRHLGAADELRIALVAGSSCLANGAFLRGQDLGPFTATEVGDVRQLLPIATTILRRALGRVTCAASSQPPVVIMLDGKGEVTGMSVGGGRILEDLRINEPHGELPGIIKAAATKARWSRTSTDLTTRVQGRSGQWLRLHIAPMEGEVGAVALTVESARPDDLVRILLESYGLTPRETEIVLLLCRGHSTKDIAAELLISSHTVRDHVKAIYEKSGVNSRGELLATLFSNHVMDRLHATVSHLA
jgi:DNA-binding CsgD family transcriptional regulator